MADLKLYNSLTRRLEPFVPKEPGKVRVYNCGPTVYKRQHLGNMRRFVFADVLRRTLELLGYEVRDITNITDVGHLTDDELDQGEDKLEKAAREEKLTPQAIADQQTALFKQDLAILNIEPAHKYPRAAEHINEMLALIQKLIERGHAYVTKTGVYFDITSFPAYGQLSGNSVAALNAGARIEVREDKKHPADFALWKFDTAHLQKWDSPWGVGYPGWHIECSAMSQAYLGSDIDIHTGGEDNKFPHHENEIAQSEGATGERFVRVWLHNAHLQMAGKKLAKREGEQLTVDSLRDHGHSPLAFRLFALTAHYRHKLDFSWEALADAQKHLEAVKQLLRRLQAIPSPNEGEGQGGVDNRAIEQFTTALANDLNTPEALAVFLNYLREANAALDATPTAGTAGTILATLHQLDRVLGVIAPLEHELAETNAIPTDVQQLVDDREAARDQKDFAASDTLRKRISDLGYRVEDTPDGPRVYKN